MRKRNQNEMIKKEVKRKNQESESRTTKVKTVNLLTITGKFETKIFKKERRIK